MFESIDFVKRNFVNLATAKEGDVLLSSGVFDRVEVKQTKRGDAESVVFLSGDGEEKIETHIWNVAALKFIMDQNDVVPGDKLRIVYGGKKPCEFGANAGNPMHTFKIGVQRAVPVEKPSFMKEEKVETPVKEEKKVDDELSLDDLE